MPDQAGESATPIQPEHVVTVVGHVLDAAGFQTRPHFDAALAALSSCDGDPTATWHALEVLCNQLRWLSEPADATPPDLAWDAANLLAIYGDAHSDADHLINRLAYWCEPLRGTSNVVATLVADKFPLYAVLEAAAVCESEAE